jgi:anion-transporting  ArsA/GET3 family ATPase
MTLGDVVRRHRVVVCVGSGGVGKTTAAAAIGLWGAREGRRTVVITIDPARRLATSLGLETVGREPHEIPRALLESQGVRGQGTLAAMMLDQKGAWDALVERHAPTPEVRDRVFANAFYQSLSQTFAGSYEYMAVEELSRLYENRDYDLIVVDTPPTKHALDFLEAPRRLEDFLDRRVIRWFVRPYVSATWTGVRAMNRTVTFILRRLEDATGIAALVTISEFFAAMSGMFEGFHERVERAYAILQGRDTGFLLVTSPDEQILGEAEYLSRKMAELRMPLKGVIFNRTHAEYQLPPGMPNSVEGGESDADDVIRIRDIVARALGVLPGDAGAAAAQALVENFMRYQTLGRGEGLRMEAFSRGLRRGVPVVRVPNFPHDLHDIAGLAATHRYLFAA